MPALPRHFLPPDGLWPADTPILDTTGMRRNVGDTAGLLRQLYGVFLKNEDELRGRLEASLTHGDLPGARMAAHAAAGAARIAGAEQLASLCSLIEEALVHGNPTLASSAATHLPAVLDAVRAEVALV
ncbi:HPt (histidine-containing phosphotransfer) domain-containing protein [Azospirillum fermentarium]|uniref:Hpt domain-containing protein n=1 Tax=Azospirillum fermentarium TaxID=1233114 RepID=UPI00222671A9|nr:Hpt domain-containing protein [Azospirillum fermentarium]MCW2245988.1 HPt (histidine-containing phosphotransfer) domain-containing protein [Azospirillum fermentarium]